jgi:Flp pilus assembly protein TadD
VTCEKGQVPICIVKDGKVTSACKSVPPEKKTVAQQSAWLLSIVLGKEVTVEELMRNPDYQKILLEARLDSAQVKISFFPLTHSINDLPSGPMLRHGRGGGGGGVGGCDIAAASGVIAYLYPSHPARSSRARNLIDDPKNQVGAEFESYYKLGSERFDQGRLIEALAAFKQAQQIALQSKSKVGLAEAYECVGDTLCELDRCYEARNVFEEAVRLAPDDPYLIADVGMTYYASGEHAEAEDKFKTAIRLKPDESMFYGLLGSALFFQRKHVEAELAFKKAVQLKPNDADAIFSLGVTLCTERNYKDASEALKQAIVLKPDDATAIANLGSTLFRLGQFAEAENMLKKTLQLKPDCVTCYIELGRVLYTQLKYSEAEKAFRKSTTLMSNEPRFHAALGEALYAQQKYAEAEAEYRKALSLDPKNTIYQDRLNKIMNAK